MELVTVMIIDKHMQNIRITSQDGIYIYRFDLCCIK